MSTSSNPDFALHAQRQRVEGVERRFHVGHFRGVLGEYAPDVAMHTVAPLASEATQKASESLGFAAPTESSRIAVIRKQYYVVTGDGILVFDMRTWGWIAIFWGILLVLTGLALLSGSLWARWFTVALVALNTVGELLFLGSTQYPLWSITVVSLNIIVIYALVVRREGYPEEAARDRELDKAAGV